MFDLFKDAPALAIPVIALLGAATVFVVWIIAHYWHAVRQQDVEAALKQDMLNRGYGPDDIERVLIASAAREERLIAAAQAPQETVSDNEYALVEKLIDEGHSIDDIERLVRAFKAGKPTKVPPQAAEV